MVFYFTCQSRPDLADKYIIYMGRDKFENEQLIKWVMWNWEKKYKLLDRWNFSEIAFAIPKMGGRLDNPRIIYPLKYLTRRIR